VRRTEFTNPGGLERLELEEALNARTIIGQSPSSCWGYEALQCLLEVVTGLCGGEDCILHGVALAGFDAELSARLEQAAGSDW